MSRPLMMSTLSNGSIITPPGSSITSSIEAVLSGQVHAREQRHLAKDSLATVRHQTKTAAEFLAAEETVSRDRALHEIRSDLTEKIKLSCPTGPQKSPFCTDL